MGEETCSQDKPLQENGYFFDCKNMTEDDWRLVAVIFLKANTLGRNMTAKYDC